MWFWGKYLKNKCQNTKNIQSECKAKTFKQEECLSSKIIRVIVVPSSMFFKKNVDVLSEVLQMLNSLYTQFSFTGLSLEKSEMRNLMRILNLLTLNPVNSRVKATFSSALVGGLSAAPNHQPLGLC